VRYAKAADIQDRLAEHVETNKLGYVKADERSNQLIVKALPERMKELEQLIRALDRKTREVLIDAKIVKIAYSDSRDTGIDWDAVFANLKFHGLDKKGDFRTAKTGTEPSETPAVTRLNLKPLFERLAVKQETPEGGFHDVRPGELVFGTVARDGYELFRYLQTVGQTKIISNPRLMVTENQEAKILVGTREAYVTSTTTTGQTTSTTAEDVQFIDVGIQLSVTPAINEDGYVTMKIKPEISSVVRTLTTPSRNQIPIVDTSSAETKVMVADGTTVVLGGLRKNEKKFSDEQIPYLGHIPLLGPLLFKRNDRDDQLTELVVFLTPRIVDGTRLVTGDEPSVGFFGYRGYAPIVGDPAIGDPQASAPQPAR
jgi:type IV pilus assembly protein PilQ